MTISSVILSIAVVVLFIVSIVFIYYYTVAKATLIDPSNCNRATSEFGVTPSTTGAVLSLCGESRKEPCIFNQIGSLEQAIDRCHRNPLICTAFSYSPIGNTTMSIIDPSQGFRSLNGTDTYVQQVNTVVTQ